MCMRVSVFFVHYNRVAFLVLLTTQRSLKFANDIHKCWLKCSGEGLFRATEMTGFERKAVKAVNMREYELHDASVSSVGGHMTTKLAFPSWPIPPQWLLRDSSQHHTHCPSSLAVYFSTTSQ